MQNLLRDQKGRFVLKFPDRKRQVSKPPTPILRARKGDMLRASARLALLREADRKLVTPPEDLPSWKFINPMRSRSAELLGDPPKGRSALAGFVAPWHPSGMDWESRAKTEPSAPPSFHVRIRWPSDGSSLSPSAAAVLALGRRQCKFPIGHPKVAGFHFCNEMKQVGLPYCVEHHRECWIARR